MSGARRADQNDAVAAFFGAIEDEESSPRLRQPLLKPGRKIADRYTLLTCIGTGGMATIWEAEDRLSDRIVAVKFLGKRYLNDPEYRLRFEAEASAASQLHSPFIVGVHDYGVTEDIPFIAMDRLYGGDLHTPLTREHRLSLSAVAAIAR